MPWPAQLVAAPGGPTVVAAVPGLRGVSPVRAPQQWAPAPAVSYAPAPRQESAVMPLNTMPVAIHRGASPVQRMRSPERHVAEAPATAQSLHSLMYATGPSAGRASFVPSEPEVPGVQQQQPAPVGQANDQDKGTDNEFMKLLDSLEVRVDLMAQMQHTRNQIQARTQAMERGASPHGSVAVPSRAARSLAGSVAFNSSPPVRPDINSFSPGRQEFAADLAKRFGGAEPRGSFATAPRQPPEGPQIIEAEGAAEARLATENAELWQQLREQRECISKLTQEVDGLQSQLSAVSELRQVNNNKGLEELRVQLQAALGRERESSAEAARLRQELLELRQQKDREALEAKAERERLLSELQQLRLAAAGVSVGAASSGVSALLTEPVLPVEPAHSGGPVTAPFSRQTCGVNVTLSDDGYVATRTRGCRQSVLLGGAPLPRQDLGWYFELEVCETVEGWVGGLGIGVTRTSPGQLRRIPDKAWRMQNTFIVGYWGCVFLNGKERRTHWRADTLPSGSRVGLLVSGDGSGDLHVFVDNTMVVSVPGALAEHALPGVELFPVVDVFAATLKVALQPMSTPPAPPWGAAEGAYSPPGSPAGSLASVPRSICSSK